MQFQIPQFIEDETLLLGPLTVKQSLYVGGSLVAVFFIHILPLPGTVTWMLAALLVATGIALGFLKIEGRPLPAVIVSFFAFFSSSKLYLWEMKSFVPKILKRQQKIKEKETMEQRQYTLLKDGGGSLSNLLFELNIGKKEE